MMVLPQASSLWWCKAQPAWLFLHIGVQAASHLLQDLSVMCIRHASLLTILQTRQIHTYLHIFDHLISSLHEKTPKT